MMNKSGVFYGSSDVCNVQQLFGLGTIRFDINITCDRRRSQNVAHNAITASKRAKKKREKNGYIHLNHGIDWKQSHASATQKDNITGAACSASIDGASSKRLQNEWLHITNYLWVKTIYGRPTHWYNCSRQVRHSSSSSINSYRRRRHRYTTK